jgi:hypothetical protein
MVADDAVSCGKKEEDQSSSSREWTPRTSPMHAAAYFGYGRGVDTLREILSASQGGQQCLRQWSVQQDGKGRTPLQSAQAGRQIGVVSRLTHNEAAADFSPELTAAEVVIGENAETVEELEKLEKLEELEVGGDKRCELDVIEWDDDAKNGTKLFEQYYFTNTPVLIRSHDVVKKWTSFQLWRNATYFHDKFPTRKFHAFGRRRRRHDSKEVEEVETNALETSFVLTMPEFAKMLSRQEKGDTSSSSTTTSFSTTTSSPWIVETDTKTFVKGSESDAVFKRHIRAMTGRFEFFESILKRTTPNGQYSNYQFMIAPKGTGASPHFHNSALNVLYSGEKMWALFPPSHSFYETTPVRDWFERERATRESQSGSSSKKYRRYMECVQRPGEIIYVPDGWGHAVISLVDTSIGLAHLYTA